jgi:UDP-N-acetylmuramoyl-tripeptide--D-alanyl-D-alanine ligase
MFKVDELLRATGGRLASGNSQAKIKGISIDSRKIKPQQAFIAIKGSNFDGHDFISQAVRKGASCVISNPLSNNDQNPKKTVLIEVKDTVRALGDIARFQRDKFDIPVIAITGSNGKTTAKEMVSWVLSAKYRVLKNEGTKNNQIGLPLTLLNLHRNCDIVVLELGSNHFGEIGYLAEVCAPNIGIITNIGPSHLEFFGDLVGVLKEKYALIENLKEPYIAILNADDRLLSTKVLALASKPLVLGFGMRPGCDFSGLQVSELPRAVTFYTAGEKFSLNTPGRHNIYNALAAIAVGRIFGVANKDIAKRLSTFKFPEGRMNFVTARKIRFIDDTYNSNPLSLKYALELLADYQAKGRKILVMGDMLELGKSQEEFHRQAGLQAARACDIMVAVGKLSELAAHTARSSGLNAKGIFICKSAHEARDILLNKISPKEDDIVLVKGSRAMKMEEVLVQNKD